MLPSEITRRSGRWAGGVIIQTLGWHWIFYVDLIVGAFAIPLSIKFIPPSPREKTVRLDCVALTLVSTGLTVIT